MGTIRQICSIGSAERCLIGIGARMSTAPHDLANNQDSCPTANTTADNNSSGNGQQPQDERKARREKRIHFVLCLYGLYNLVSGAFVLGIAAFLGFILATDGKHILISSNDVTLTTVLSVFQIVLLIVNAAMVVGLGIALIRNKRRHAYVISVVMQHRQPMPLLPLILPHL